MNEIDICRICANFANSSSSTNLFDRKHRSLLSQIKDITGCALKNAKNYPKFICEYCEEGLKQSYLFRKRCQDSQQYFNSEKYKEFVHKKPDEEVTLEIETDMGGEDECSDIVDEERDTKENLKSILFEADSKVISAAFKENTLINEEEDSEGHTSDNVVLSEFVKAENIQEEKTSKHKRTPNNIRRKQAKKIINDKLQEKIQAKIKKEKNAIEKVDFMCDQCGNHFTCRHHFTTHLRRHANDKRYQCELCPAKFFTHSELKRHMRRHTGERPFACQHCQRRFTDFSTRVKHERIHTNERPFKCEQCGKAFTTSYVLKNHMLVHTGERSFKCQICNKAFQRQVHLDVHFRSISHKQMEEKYVPQMD